MYDLNTTSLTSAPTVQDFYKNSGEATAYIRILEWFGTMEDKVHPAEPQMFNDEDEG